MPPQKSHRDDKELSEVTFRLNPHEKEERSLWSMPIIHIIRRLFWAVFIMVVGNLLAFAATLGPAIAPYIWNCKLDGVIRLGLMATGFTMCIGAIIWLIWPLRRFVGQLLNAPRH